MRHLFPRWTLIAPLALAALAIPSVPAEAQEPGSEESSKQQKKEDIPPGRTHYMGRKIAHYMHHTGAEWLTRDSRDREENTALLMKQLDIKKGQTVADIGCGNGYFTLRMARRVGPRGKVFASDIQVEMLRKLAGRAAKAEPKLENIQLVHGTVADPKLPANSCDLILLVDAYHEFSHPVHMLRNMRKALKPEGRLAIVEYRAEDPDVPIKRLHKMSRKQIMKELPPNGLKLAESFDKLPWQHLLFFKRAPLPEDAPEPTSAE